MNACGRVMQKLWVINKVYRRQMGLQNLAYKLSRFNQYGLMRDDMLNEDIDPDVAEAIRRCPRDIIDQRNFRIMRAIQLSITKDILPKDQWTTLECDELYLTPYIEEIKREKQEQREWNNTH